MYDTSSGPSGPCPGVATTVVILLPSLPATPVKHIYNNIEVVKKKNTAYIIQLGLFKPIEAEKTNDKTIEKIHCYPPLK